MKKVHLLRTPTSKNMQVRVFCNRQVVNLKVSKRYRDTTCLTCQLQCEQEYYESNGYRERKKRVYPWPKQ